jgi:flagellar basal-body rod modification protein FlgD
MITDPTTLRPAATTAPPVNRALPSDAVTFLNMLTVQMRNQDPLNPMAPTDFAVQLATFSSVEQQLQTNTLLQSMLSRAGLADMGSWIGMEARIEGEGWFDGSAMSLSARPAPEGERAFLVVRNALGQVVDRREADIAGGAITWEGIDENGLPLPEGQYFFTLEALSGEQLVGSAPVASFMRVEEVRMDAGAAILILQGGMEISGAEVSGLRKPAA